MRTVTILSVCGLASAALAQGPAVVDYGAGGVFDIFYGGSTGDVIGYRFTADVDMFVTDLGVANDDVNDGVLDSAHMVGIWRNSDMALLGSVSVDASGTPVGRFIYESVAPIALSAGESYTAGAMYAGGDLDSYTSGPGSITLDGISGTTAVFPSATDLGFVFPTEESGGNAGRIGPNFIWEPIPAPSSLALLGLGGLVATRRRR